MFNAKTLSAGLLILATVIAMGVCDRTEATPLLDNSIHLDSDATAEVQLIQNLIRDKQFDKAMIAIEALEKRQPQNPTPFNLKGAVYLGKNDVANARKSFEHAMGLETKSIAAAMNLAQLDLQAKNPEAARQRFQGILAKDSTNIQAMVGLAGVAAATGQETEYVTWLEKAVKAAPSDVRPRILLANYYLEKNEVRNALAVAREAQIAAPDNAQALDMLGRAQLAAGETDNAVITYGKLVALTPNDPVAHHKLATAQAAAKNIGATRASLNKALVLKPDYVDAEILLAATELDAGRYGEALKIAQQIQKQHPKSAAGFVLQGDILMAQKQFGPALQAYEKAVAINDNSRIAVKVHQALSAGGNAKEADAKLLQWLKDQPRDINARTYLAATYAKEGQNKQAVEQYQLLLESDPKNIRALNDLAWLYQQERDPRALATAEQAYQLKSDNTHVMDTLGWILVEQGKTARGLELLQKAAQADPASTAIRYHFAATLAKTGDKARARKELEDLLARNKTFPQRQEAETLLGQL